MSGGSMAENKSTTKKCTKCKKLKDFDRFYIDNQKKDGLASACRDCMSKVSKVAYHKNIEKEKIRSKKYRENNKEEIEISHKKYRTENKVACDLAIKKWENNNRERTRKRKKVYMAYRRKNDINFRIASNLRRQITGTVKTKRSKKSQQLLGCTISDFRKYLERLFKTGMSWENYSRKGWQIDHIIPCCMFDLTIQENQKKCFHFTNLQPMWAIDNFKKGGRYVGRCDGL